ncbi:MAG: rhomboid family intramembrane serine protease [Peptococcia bacterium]
MIPLRDSTRSNRFPIVTVSLIAINALIYLYQKKLTDATDLQAFMLQYSFIPTILTNQIRRFSVLGLLHPPLVTSMFLHGDFFHIFFNMLYLWIFGDNIEDRLGRIRFIIFYLLCGVLATGAHYLTDINSAIPLVGASGAIAGVLGAYIITFPRARITSIIILIFIITVREIPAIFYLLIWFFINLYQGLTTSAAGGGTAYWAHIGGFVAGIVLMKLLDRREPQEYSEL